jgi:hypothetical protein
LRAGVPPVEDEERSKEFHVLIELKEEEEMGEEERGALRMAMHATANGGGVNGVGSGLRNGVSLDDDDDEEIGMPHVSAAAVSNDIGNMGNDGKQFAHHVLHQAQLQAQAQAQAQVQSQAQAQATQQYQQFRTRAHSSIHNGQHGHGHHPYAAAYHSMHRPGSQGGLPPHPAYAVHSAHTQSQTHGGHPQMHSVQGHVLPFNNGSDFLLASELHLTHGSFGSSVGVDIFSPPGSSPQTPGGAHNDTTGLEMIYGVNMIPGTGTDNGEYKTEWANTASHPFAHGGLITSHLQHSVSHGYGFDDSASNYSSSTGPISHNNNINSNNSNNHPSSNNGINVNDGGSPRLLLGGSSSPIGSGSSSVTGRSRAGSMNMSMVNGGGVENVSVSMKGTTMNGTTPPPSHLQGMSAQVGGGSFGGNAVMNMFF